MTPTRLLLAAVVLSTAAAAVNAQSFEWVSRPQDWGRKGVILLPPDRTTGSTLPVMTYPTPPKPVPPPTPNYLTYRGNDSSGRAVFINPTTGDRKTVSNNQPALLGGATTFGQMQKMQNDRPLGQYAPSKR